MKKIEIDFLMFIDDVEVKHYICQGNINNNSITFNDNDGYYNLIKYNDISIQYYRKGSTIMKLKFIQNQTENGIFFVDGLRFLYDINTTKCLKKDNEILIEYELYSEEELVSKHKLILNYRYI